MSRPTSPTPTATGPFLETDDDGVAWITFDDPARALNVLTEEVMETFAARVDEVAADARQGAVRAVVIWSGKPDSFMAGADVDAIAALEDPAEAEAKIRRGQAVYNRLAALPVPTLAAIHGVCVGGGLEMALACTHRVCSDASATRLGLPEVLLGILPAWGGTTRLPRLVGLRPALDLLLTGKLIPAGKANRMGLCHRTFPTDLFRREVAAYARRLADGTEDGLPGRPALGDRLLESNPLTRRALLHAARRRVLQRTGGHYPAPLRILEILQDHFGHSVDRSLAAEATLAAELIVSSTCKNLIHVFRLREGARKGTGTRLTPDEAPRIEVMGVVGAGVMGGGIAQLAAYRQIPVRMRDVRQEAVRTGLRHARARFEDAVRRRKLTRREAEQRMDLVSAALDWSGFAAADLVVEAVVERLEVKQSVLREAEEVVSPRCVLATNTSSLSVDAMAADLRHPERFCGMHFFNPVHRMPLVEVVRGSATSDETVAAVYRLSVRLGKVPVVVADGPGFLVNRILGPYLNEAGHLLADGASVEEIDGAAREFGMPMGPLRLVDEVGIDVSTHAGRILHEGLGPRLAPAPPLAALSASGRLGRKGGVGFYRYEKGRERGVDPSVYGDLGLAPPAGRGELDARTIRRRLVVAMIHEAARALEEGIVTRAADVDLAMIMGTGFPPFRGGLLRFADTFHLRAVLMRSRSLQEEYGPRFEPPELLERLAREGRTFYQAFGDAP